MFFYEWLHYLRISVPQQMARTRLFQGKAERVSVPLPHYYARQRVVLAALERAATECGVRLLDPVPVFCEDGVLLYKPQSQRGRI